MYPKSEFRVPEIGQKMNLWQLLTKTFHQFFIVFDGFSEFWSTFFVFNPILLKLGEIVVHMDTTTSPNFNKIGLNKKMFLFVSV